MGFFGILVRLALADHLVRREFSPVVRSNALLRAKDCCETCGSRQQLELHHMGHRRDASLFNCLVLRALPPSRASPPINFDLRDWQVCDRW